jgi:hypothetical protein
MSIGQFRLNAFTKKLGKGIAVGTKSLCFSGLFILDRSECCDWADEIKLVLIRKNRSRRIFVLH